MSIIASNTGDASIYFRDPDDTNIGAIQYDNTSNNMLFRINDAERMRINSDGRLLVGTTATTIALTTGVRLYEDGRGFFYC